MATRPHSCPDPVFLRWLPPLAPPPRRKTCLPAPASPAAPPPRSNSPPTNWSSPKPPTAPSSTGKASRSGKLLRPVHPALQRPGVLLNRSPLAPLQHPWQPLGQRPGLPGQSQRRSLRRRRQDRRRRPVRHPPCRTDHQAAGDLRPGTTAPGRRSRCSSVVNQDPSSPARTATSSLSRHDYVRRVTGLIEASLGTVIALGAGTAVTLDIAGG